MNLNIPDELRYEVRFDKIKFSVNGQSTGWMSCDDSFVKRINKNNLNSKFSDKASG